MRAAIGDQIGLTPQSQRVTVSGLSLFADFGKPFETNFPQTQFLVAIKYIFTYLCQVGPFLQQIEIFEILGMSNLLQTFHIVKYLKTGYIKDKIAKLSGSWIRS